MQCRFIAVLLMCHAFSVLTTASVEKRDADQIVVYISQIVSLYLPATQLPDLGGELLKAASAANETAPFSQVLQSIIIGPPPPYITAIPPSYQTQIASLESALSVLRDSIISSALAATTGYMNVSSPSFNTSITTSTGSSANFTTVTSHIVSFSGNNTAGSEASSSTLSQGAITSTPTTSTINTPKTSSTSSILSSTSTTATTSTTSTTSLGLGAIIISAFGGASASTPSVSTSSASKTTSMTAVFTGAASPDAKGIAMVLGILGLALAL